MLSDSEGVTDFYGVSQYSDGGTGSSILPEIFTNNELSKERMNSTTIKSLFKDRHFNLIKIDVQGAEIMVINGGRELFQKADWIISEVSLVEYNKGAPLADEYYDFVEKLGFEPYKKIHDICINNTIVQQDIAFKKSVPAN